MDNAGSHSSISSDRRKFKLGIISLVLAFLPLAGAFFVGGATSNALSTRIGAWFGTVVISLILGWIAFHVSSRSNLIANVIFCGVMVLSNVAPHLTKARNDQAMRDVRASNAEFLKQLEEQLDSTDGAPSALAGLDRQIRTNIEAARKSTGSQAEVLNATIEVLANLRPTVAEFDESTKRFVELVSLGHGAIKSREDIAARVGTVDDFVNKVSRMREGFADLPMAVAVRVPSIPAGERSKFCDGLGTGMSLSLVQQLRDEELKMGGAFKAILALLDATWGKWKMDGEPPVILFDEDADLEAYMAEASKMDGAAARQSEIMEQFLQAARDRARQP